MSRRAEQRNADLARRMDARSRHNAKVQKARVAPAQFHSMRPWWELRAERRAQQAAKERAQRPVILPIRQTQTVPGILAATLQKAVAYRPAWLGAAHA